MACCFRRLGVTGTARRYGELVGARGPFAMATVLCPLACLGGRAPEGSDAAGFGARVRVERCGTLRLYWLRCGW
jgi:hypothetical protein